MFLSKLLDRVEYDCVQGSVDRTVSGVVYDSRKVEQGCLFICIQGANFDGHDFALQAAEQGAGALVVSKDVTELDGLDVAVIRVKDTRYAMAFISAAWFGHPAEKLKTIGITGTKGKTTSTYLVKSILEHAGYRVGLIGTIEIIIGEKHIHADNTTPESYLLQEYFAEMAEAGMDAVVMEVSSQALMLHRTQGFVFDYGIFTNLEPDHIGPNEHKDFEDYLHCKSLLFRQCLVGIGNGDDVHFDRVMAGHTCSLESFGMGE
ncbi:MAG: UDP-N-acetylmuramoyl-L-alanyl-D-glutamate--2,6-diaminopimelate ligase, partial [Acetatifactor sp.]|nr:UDP-N-acetylmuramoyl-L-alanyl-D-glutamate--2,6-diaminopimelate ligase [Acetatifactor sp.]